MPFQYIKGRANQNVFHYLFWLSLQEFKVDPKTKQVPFSTFKTPDKYFGKHKPLKHLDFQDLARLQLLKDDIIYMWLAMQNEPRHEKTCLRGLWPGKTQTNLLSYRD